MHYYFSPFLFCSIKGIFYIFLSVILLIILLNIDCGNSVECLYVSEIQNISGYAIFLYVLKSLLNSLSFFTRYLIMNDFTLFHIIVVFIFIGIVTNFLDLTLDFIYYELIIMIITFSIEIFFLFVLFEIIELNFCGLNRNLRRNITNRSRKESNLFDYYELDNNTVNSANTENDSIMELEHMNDNDKYY